MSLETLLERRNNWIEKVGKKFLFNKSVNWLEQNRALAAYYNTLAFFEKQIANKYEDEYSGEEVKIY